MMGMDEPPGVTASGASMKKLTMRDPPAFTVRNMAGCSMGALRIVRALSA